jgi:hypothetical protein
MSSPTNALQKARLHAPVVHPACDNQQLGALRSSSHAVAIAAFYETPLSKRVAWSEAHNLGEPKRTRSRRSAAAKSAKGASACARAMEAVPGLTSCKAPPTPVETETCTRSGYQ